MLAWYLQMARLRFHISQLIMYILGINAAFHDTAAALVKDGQIIAAAEEERFTHIKHGKRPVPFSTWELPYHAIDYCLKEAGITLKDVDRIAYSFDPDAISETTFFEELNFSDTVTKAQNSLDELFLTQIRQAPAQLRDGFPHHLQKRLKDAGNLEDKWEFVNHHIAHAASAFFPSPFTKAAVMTLDGRGERVSTGYFLGDTNSLTEIASVNMPHSLGMLYEKITTYLGFLYSSDEYKVMALASYGKPTYLDDFRSLVHVGDDGQYSIDHFDPVQIWGPARHKDNSFDELHFNIAHSLQKILEETVLKLCWWLYDQTHAENLCLAGGVALNCVLNAVIRDKGPFKQVWVQPAAGDAGTALGAAQWLDIQMNATNHQRYTAEMKHVYWGPSFSDEEIEKFMIWAKMPYRRLDNIPRQTAELLAQDKIIAWYQGRMEFGPRSLGSRSILASPIHPEMQSRLNDIKDREDFRPVAPVILQEDAADYFENCQEAPFMLFVFNVKNEKAGNIPAVRHTDGTARVQTINKDQHPVYYQLISEFKALTGVPVLVNTSFNTRGEPIVCSPRDAVECFWTSPFDALIINSFILEK
jgi:carbamoyltransferase